MTVNRSVRKRHVLTGMKYDRVDLVGDGANGHADILIAKNKDPQTAKRAMGTYQCADCGVKSRQVSKSKSCSACGSENLDYIEVVVSKKVVRVGKAAAPRQGATKKVPKNDDATNAGQYTFEDEQYDQDNGENGAALGDAMERSVLNKNAANEDWFEVEFDDVGKSGLTVQTGDGSGKEVDDVDNEKNERQKEGPDPDDDIELKAMTLPTGKSRTFFFGKKKAKPEKPGFNTVDHADEGSQEVAEDAEQMYRSESQPTRAAQTRQDSTRSKVVVGVDKARQGRKRTNAEGLHVLANGSEGIHSKPGVKRNGTGTGSKKSTRRKRTQVAPPNNPLDGKGVAKSMDPVIPTIEALNLGLQFAENIELVTKSGKTELYETVLSDFVEAANAAAAEWVAGSTVTKSSDLDAQVDDIAERAYGILAKASGDDTSDDSDDDDSDDEDDSDEDDSEDSKDAKDAMGKLKKNKVRVVVKKSRVVKTLAEEDPYEGLSEVVVKKLQQFDELLELQQAEKYTKLAKSLRSLPGFDEEKISKQLRDAFEADEDGGKYLYQTLTAAANQMKDSDAYRQYGMPGQGSGSTDPMSKAREFAKSKISKSGDGPTEEMLMVEYMQQNPADFYQEAKSV